MAKRLKKARSTTKLTKSQQEAVAITIAQRANKGMQAFVVAGATVLQDMYGWTEEETGVWATETVQLGTKYLKLDGEGEPNA